MQSLAPRGWYPAYSKVSTRGVLGMCYEGSAEVCSSLVASGQCTGLFCPLRRRMPLPTWYLARGYRPARLCGWHCGVVTMLCFTVPAWLDACLHCRSAQGPRLPTQISTGGTRFGSHTFIRFLCFKTGTAPAHTCTYVLFIGGDAYDMCFPYLWETAQRTLPP